MNCWFFFSSTFQFSLPFFFRKTEIVFISRSPSELAVYPCKELTVNFVLAGWVYKLYMGLLAVFCTNSINIHAGLNGLEVGQTVVIASAVSINTNMIFKNLTFLCSLTSFCNSQILIHNLMQIGASSDPEYKQAHAFSIYLVQPLLATSLALLSYNW